MSDEYGPRGKSMWIKVYDVGCDALIAVPVRADGPANHAIKVGQAWPISAAEAAALNASHGDSPYIRDYVANRLQALEAQGYELPGDGAA